MARNQSLEVFRNMVMPYEPTTFEQGSGADLNQTTGDGSDQSIGGAEQPSAEGFDKASE